MLGRGGFGLVWEAYDPVLDRIVAVKIPRAAGAESDGSRRAMIEEARKVARLNLAGVAPVYDFGEQDGRCYIVSKFMEGGTLADRLRLGPLAIAEAARLVIDVAETLHQAHLKNIVHRDIKPSNILLDGQGRPWVADFGLAATEHEQAAEREGVVGTWAYMSPELARGENRYVDARTDIYSLGMVLYELLTGRVAFSGAGDRELLQQISRREPRPPRTINEAVPPALERICLKCLAKDVSKRYLTARDLASDLAAWLQNQPGVMQSPMPGAATNERNWRMVLAAGALASLVLAATALVGWKGGFFRESLVRQADTAGNGAADGAGWANPARRPSGGSYEQLIWEERFSAVPKELFWPGYGGATSAGFRDAIRAFEVTSEGPRLYSLGNLERGRHTISVALRQPHWQAECGVFLGYHEEAIDGRTCAAFQLISVGAVSEPEGGRRFRAARRIVFIEPRLGHVYTRKEAGYQDLPWPPADTALKLELQVSPSGMESLRWGGVELTRLLGEEAEQSMGADRCLGAWGLFHGGVTTWFQDPSHASYDISEDLSHGETASSRDIRTDSHP